MYIEAGGCSFICWKAYLRYLVCVYMSGKGREGAPTGQPFSSHVSVNFGFNDDLKNRVCTCSSQDGGRRQDYCSYV